MLKNINIDISKKTRSEINEDYNEKKISFGSNHFYFQGNYTAKNTDIASAFQYLILKSANKIFSLKFIYKISINLYFGSLIA